MYLYVSLCARVRLPKGRDLVSTDSPEHTGLAMSVNCSPDTGGIIEGRRIWTPLPSKWKWEENQQCWAPTGAGPLQASLLVIRKSLCLASVVSPGLDTQEVPHCLWDPMRTCVHVTGSRAQQLPQRGPSSARLRWPLGPGGFFESRDMAPFYIILIMPGKPLSQGHLSGIRRLIKNRR